MLTRFRRYLRRWLEVPVYTSGTEIQFALLNYLASQRPPAHLDRGVSMRLLEHFLVEGFGRTLPGEVTPTEKHQFLAALHRFQKGETVAIREFPFIKDQTSQFRLGAWLSNLLREDLGRLANEGEEIAPLSVFSPSLNLEPVRGVYEVLEPHDHAEKVINLQRYLPAFDLQYWHELAPYFVGPVLMIGGKQLLPEDALLIPRIVADFVADPSLGMVVIQQHELRFLRTRICKELIVPNLPLRMGLPLPNLARKVQQHGGRVQELWYPVAHGE
ncbi:MAG: hypothetical protein AAF399_12240 [Bacteroidota bacterium]